MEVSITWLEACPVIAAVVTNWWGPGGGHAFQEISPHYLDHNLHLNSSQLISAWWSDLSVHGCVHPGNLTAKCHQAQLGTGHNFILYSEPR
jgi:hypothetical protein